MHIRMMITCGHMISPVIFGFNRSAKLDVFEGCARNALRTGFYMFLHVFTYFYMFLHVLTCSFMFFNVLKCFGQMVPLVHVQMPFLSWCSVLSRRRGSLVCAAPIHLGRQLGLLPGFPLSGGNESPRQLRQRIFDLSLGMCLNRRCRR